MILNPIKIHRGIFQTTPRQMCIVVVPFRLYGLQSRQRQGRPVRAVESGFEVDPAYDAIIIYGQEDMPKIRHGAAQVR